MVPATAPPAKEVREQVVPIEEELVWEATRTGEEKQGEGQLERRRLNMAAASAEVPLGAAIGWSLAIWEKTVECSRALWTIGTPRRLRSRLRHRFARREVRRETTITKVSFAVLDSGRLN
jgi:hypothetical protein